MDLYFDCTFGISGDMAVGALLGLIPDKKILDNALKSLNIEDEFEYKIKEVTINSIKANDFDVILKHRHNDNSHHHHRNLEDINKIIDKADIKESAKNLAKKIFKIVAVSESEVHNKPIEQIHFHEIGATDSIVDIISFAVLFEEINPENVYFSTLSEGRGSVECQHGTLNVPVPAVCEILKEYKIPITITDNIGEMITPTGAAIVASLYGQNNGNKEFPQKFIIEKISLGAGKRKYKNPVLRVMQIKSSD